MNLCQVLGVVEQNSEALAEVGSALEVDALLTWKENLEGHVKLKAVDDLLFRKSDKTRGVVLRLGHSKGKGTTLVARVGLQSGFVVVLPINRRLCLLESTIDVVSLTPIVVPEVVLVSKSPVEPFHDSAESL